MLNQRIAVVSTSRETLDGVQEYLRRVGARPSAVPLLEDAAMAARQSDALLLFADDFPTAATLRTLDGLSIRLLVVVTQEVESFRTQGARLARGRMVVLRRPAWGWMLVEALRGSGRKDPANHV
jgi:hypothetical protein